MFNSIVLIVDNVQSASALVSDTFGNIYLRIVPIFVPTCGPTSEPTYCPAVGQHVY